MKVAETMKYLLPAFVILLVLTAVFFFSGDRQPMGAGMSLELDPYAGSYIDADFEVDQKSGGIAIPGWSSIHVEANKTLVDVNLTNPEDNIGKYDMVFSLYLTGEEKALAETGLIPAGKSALKLELGHELSPGEYPAVIHVQPYRVSDGSATNNANVETMLIVK